MIESRYNPEAKRNSKLRDFGKTFKDNRGWLSAALEELEGEGVMILLVGGSDVMHFRARVAQSHARIDLLPSYWSDVLVAPPGKRPRFHHVPMVPSAGSSVPKQNAIERLPTGMYADQKLFPNIGLIRFPSADAEVARRRLKELTLNRLTVDLVTPVVRWLGFLWGAAGATNPLLDGMGFPSSIFVDEVLGAAGIDGVPGLAERAACPEAIWQGSLWWADYYENAADGDRTSGCPVGLHRIRQKHATAVG